LVERGGAGVTGQAAETFVDFNQQAVALAAQQQAVGRSMEGFGELLFGGLQQLLGFLELGDIAHHYHDGFNRVELEGLRGDKPGEGLAVAAQKRHFKVANTGCLDALQQLRTDARDAPYLQFRAGSADHFLGGQADLIFERFIDLQQTAIGKPRDHQDVGALLEDRGKLLLGQLQRLLGALGLADINHQAAQHRLMAVFDQADNIAYPQTAAVGGDHSVINAVVAVGAGFAIAIGFGADQVGGVNDVAPEARNQPMGSWVTQQVLGVGRHVTVGEIGDAGFPGNSGQAFYQAAIVVLAAAQFLFKRDAAGNFRTQPAIDPNHDGQYGD